MATPGSGTNELVKELFSIHPDYMLCQTLVANVLEGRMSHASALKHMSDRAQVAKQNLVEIESRLNGRRIEVDGKSTPLESLSLRDILRQGDEAFTEIVSFYFKHPYAHNRTYRGRWIPRWIRTFFLRVLVGNSKQRGLDLDYPAYTEMLKLL